MLRNMKETAGGRPIFGTQYVGLLAEQILAETATGPNGPGAMYNDGLEAGKRYRMLLADPASFPGTVYENGSFSASGSVVTTYRLYEDNLLVPYSGGGFDVPLSVVVGTAPTISVQPQAQSAVVGGAFAFSVLAAGDAPLTYQWRRNGINLAGATGSTYSSLAGAGDNGAVYSVRVANGAGFVVSANAVLTVSAVTVRPRRLVVQAQNRRLLWQ